MSLKNYVWCLALLFLAAVCYPSEWRPAQQASPVPAPVPPAAAKTDPAFLRAADEVLEQMSKLLDLPIKQPLKKSIRSKDEIRAYLIKQENEDEPPEKRYADQRALEAFGLIPKNFPLDSFLLDILTDQVAGLYDPKQQEFYIADWIPVEQQRSVMSHELTHALDDQYFQIDSWLKAARPNDDAEMARDAVVEGSAVAAMLDYALLDQKVSVRELPDVTALVRAGALGEMEDDPKLKTAPLYIRDDLLFPYLAGLGFSQQFLKAHSGWNDFKFVFQNPPVSTQQILHPALYLAEKKPEEVVLPDVKKIVPDGWRELDENVMGEFGLEEILKQQAGQDQAERISPAWMGDRYAIFENEKTKQTLLILLLALDSGEHAANFLNAYAEVLQKQFPSHGPLFRRANYVQFRADQAAVFLRCIGRVCLSIRGAERQTLDRMNRALGWPPAPAAPPAALKGQTAHPNGP